MDRLKIRSPAKINLFLNVIGKRPDGYHELESIFQTVNLFDTIEIHKAKQGISIKTDQPNLPTDRRNLVYQVVELVKKKYKIRQGIRIFIHKNIPIGSGLGGGSSNVASVLMGLNRMWKLGLSRDELAWQGAKIGSDVPFFIYGGTALVKGRGEIVFPLKINKTFYYLLVSPQILIPTKEIYRQLKLYLTKPVNNSIGKIIRYLEKGNSKGLSQLLYNSLERVALGLYPRLKDIYLRLEENIKGGLLVSGSGSTIFRICDSSKEVNILVRQIKSDTILSNQCKVFNVSSARSIDVHAI